MNTAPRRFVGACCLVLMGGCASVPDASFLKRAYAVKIYERKGALLHAKTAVVDGVWSRVGSSNLDWRSAVDNDELDAVIVSREFAAQLAQELEFKNAWGAVSQRTTSTLATELKRQNANRDIVYGPS